jgi:hypothetical protein
VEALHGILNLAKFSLVLRMTWLWNEWDDDAKPWVGLGNTCTPSSGDLFAMATKVIIGMGRKLSFGIFLDYGTRPKDIAPLIFDLSKRKICTIDKDLEDNFWVTQINYQGGLSLDHLV